MRERIVPRLRELFPSYQNTELPAETIWFQQNCTPPHFESQVRQKLLHETFSDRWIGRRGTSEWPDRSPDLTPLDFFLWVYLKNRVYINRPIHIEELRESIRSEIVSIPPETLINSLQNFIQCLF